MSEFKGTKGKWVVDEKENWFDVQTENNDRIVSVDKSDVKFAKHDALLISKAPEMLDFINRISGEMLRNDFVLEERWYEQARKLLQEATEI